MLLIKVGGGEGIDKHAISKDIKSLDEEVIFIHGGRGQADKIAEQMGIPTKRIISPSGVTSILTDEKALEILTMTYTGLLNTQWVSAFQRVGINAVGLSGADGRIWEGVRKKHLISIENGTEKLVSNTFTGRVKKINTDLIQLLLKNTYMPVLTQPAITDDGILINSDNDLNTAVLAGAMGIKKIVVLFSAPGLLKDSNDPKSLIKTVKKEELQNMLPYAKGTMKKKVLGAIEAFANGVEKMYWGDARIDKPITRALYGEGTVIS